MMGCCCCVYGTIIDLNTSALPSYTLLLLACIYYSLFTVGCTITLCTTALCYLRGDYFILFDYIDSYWLLLLCTSLLCCCCILCRIWLWSDSDDVVDPIDYRMSALPLCIELVINADDNMFLFTFILPPLIVGASCTCACCCTCACIHSCALSLCYMVNTECPSLNILEWHTRRCLLF